MAATRDGYRFGGCIGDAPETDDSGALTEFQTKVARTFFGLESSHGFLLAGGAALAVQHLTSRPTQDLDFFTAPAANADIARTRNDFEEAARKHGWHVRRLRDSESFCRMIVSGDEELLVDLAVDSPPGLPPVVSVAGPTYAHEELA